MTEILIPSLTLLVLIAGLVWLVRLARHDTFAGPGVGHRPVDELHPTAWLAEVVRRTQDTPAGTEPRPGQRSRIHEAADTLPATYPSNGRTLTA